MLQHRNGHREPQARTFPPLPLRLPRLEDVAGERPLIVPAPVIASLLPPGMTTTMRRIARAQARGASTPAARDEARQLDLDLAVIEDSLSVHWRHAAEPEGWWQHVRPARRRWAMPDSLTLMAFTAAVSGLVGWLIVVVSGR
jgi:hypothetical protein